MPLTRKQLDKFRSGQTYPCKNHGESVLVLSGSCHSGAAGNVSYDKTTGSIKVTCFVCDRPVVEIAVARE